MACGIGLMGSLRELGKGALFWEEAALQSYPLAMDCHHVEQKGYLLLVGSGSCHSPTQEAWQVECQLDFAPTGSHCWEISQVQEPYIPYTATLVNTTNCINKYKQNKPGFCSALYKHPKAIAIILKVCTEMYIVQSQTLHYFLILLTCFLVKEKTWFEFSVRNR